MEAIIPILINNLIISGMCFISTTFGATFLTITLYKSKKNFLKKGYQPRNKLSLFKLMKKNKFKTKLALIPFVNSLFVIFIFNGYLKDHSNTYKMFDLLKYEYINKDNLDNEQSQNYSKNITKSNQGLTANKEFTNNYDILNIKSDIKVKKKIKK